jgi:sugar phosphate isomerase/epimerase
MLERLRRWGLEEVAMTPVGVYAARLPGHSVLGTDSRYLVKIGVDSYAYHRLLGEIRPGEDDPGERFPRGSLDVVGEARALGAELVSLETCFLPSPGAVDAAELAAAAGRLSVALAWGHPDGLEYGGSAEALDDLLAWIEVAPALGCRLVRLVAASPRVERGPDTLARTAGALAAACDAARAAGVELALENHADLAAAEIAELIARVDDPLLGVCLDTANAIRVGDDPLEATRLLAPNVRLVHLKDVEADWADPVAGPRSVPYGTGVVPLREVLDTLAGSGYDGAVCVELGHLGPGRVDERRLVADAVDWLRGELSQLAVLTPQSERT